MHFIDAVLNIFFPNVCGICNKICKEPICPKCKAELNKIKECKKHIYLTKSFGAHMYIFNYKDIIRKSIVNYKFNEQAYKYKAFANFIVNNKKICRYLRKYDIIIPVPISKKRKRQRGYNQSELILMEVAKSMKDICVSTNVLYKVRNTLPQSRLGKEERLNNLKNAYEVRNNEIIRNKKVLLFDDIYTTGSTVEECSKMLKNAGAYEIRSINSCKRLNNKRSNVWKI